MLTSRIGLMATKVRTPISRTALRRATSSAESSPNPPITEKAKNNSSLQREAQRNPELYILLGVMSLAFGLAGYHFARKPTSSSSEAPVGMAEGTMPWQTDDAKHDAKHDEHFKYQYHPGGDPKRGTKDAPSALHSVIVPNVTLPKKAHDQFNKWGKDDW